MPRLRPNSALLAADPARADRAQRIDALVACPRALAPMLADRMSGAGGPFRRVLLETMARRFYRVHDLEPFTDVTAGGREFLTTRYRHGGPPRRLFTGFLELDELPDAVRAFAALAARAGRRRARRRGLLRPPGRRTRHPTSWPRACARRSASVALPAFGAPDRRRRQQARHGPRDGGDGPVHLPPRTRRASSSRRFCAASIR